MLVFLPVPPSMRQAAGPLTENLPNVFTGDPQRVDLSLDTPSPRGTKRRLFLHDLPAAPWMSKVFVARVKAIGADAVRFLFGAIANRMTTRRGQLA
jgi:hypothetical protein